MYYFHPGRYGFIQSTKGHSVLKKWAYGARPFGHVEYDDAAYVERYVPSFVPLHSHYDTGREERDITRHVDSEIYLSSNLMDDVYDTAKKSHNKDAALLREATNAVVNTETYADPRAVVASRRAARGYYYPDPPQYVLPPTPPQPAPKYHYYPRPRSSSKRLEKEVVVLLNPYRLRPASVSSYNARVLTEMAMAGGVSLSDIHPPPVTRTDLDRDMEKRSAVIHALGRPAMLPYYRPYYSMYPWYHSRRYRYPYFRLPSDPYFRVASDPTYRLWSYPYNRLWSDPNYRLWSDPYYRKSSGSTRVRVLASPLPHKRRRRYRIKAALVGSKVDVVLPTGKGRRPRSQYAQSVMRDIKKQEIAQVDDKTTDANVISKNKTRPRPSVTFKRYPSTYVQDMTPKVDDVKRRVKSLLEAYKASDIVKGSAQSIIKQTNDKIYTKNTKSDIKPVSRRKLEEKIEIKTAKEEVPSPQATSSLKAHPRVPKGPVAPTLEDFRSSVSDVRRRVRRVICKNRNDPTWFK